MSAPRPGFRARGTAPPHMAEWRAEREGGDCGPEWRELPDNFPRLPANRHKTRLQTWRHTRPHSNTDKSIACRAIVRCHLTGVRSMLQLRETKATLYRCRLPAAGASVAGA